MKKIISTFAIFLLVISNITPIYANTGNNNEDDPYEEYTEQEIVLIQELEALEPDFDLSEGKVIAIDQISGSFDESSGTLTRGAIGNNYMTITLAVQRINKSGYDRFKFIATAKWDLVPTIRAQDAFAIAWSGGFARTSGNCKAYYKSQGYLADKTSQISSSPSKGVGYSVECSNYYGVALDHVTITAYVEQVNKTGVASLAASYAHATVGVSFGFGISFSSSPSISFSLNGPGTYDTMARDRAFNY